jgi:hypothetical protein
MAHHDPREPLDKFLDEAAARQRNIDWPDAQRNASSVDKFLWRGSPNPKMVQRIAAWLFGATFIGFGVVFLSLATKEPSWGDRLLAVSMGLAFAGVGLRTFRNGFPRR